MKRYILYKKRKVKKKPQIFKLYWFVLLQVNRKNTVVNRNSGSEIHRNHSKN